MPTRRLPPLWTLDEIAGATLRDRAGEKFSYFLLGCDEAVAL